MADELVNITINGQQIQAKKGQTIWQAAKDAGIFIPIYCYHPKMPPLGACRICLVDVEKAPKPQAACTTGITEGMVVSTDSPMAEKARAGVMEFLLINHPLDCPICDKGGECDLQNYAVDYGRVTGRYFEEKRHLGKAIELGPTIALDRERCIMCQRCVRFGNEIVQDEGLIIIERGAESEIGTFPGKPYVSQFSGNVTEICPVGALTSRTYRFKARPWELRHTPSVCAHCSVGCNIEVDTRLGREVVRFMSRTNDHVDDGWLCDRGRYGYGFIQSEQRLRTPLIRRGAKLEPATWAEALDFIATRLKEIRQKYGPQAIGGIAGTHSTNEDLYLFQKLLRGLIGTNNIDHYHGSFGSVPVQAIPAIHSASIEGLETAKVIVLAGADPSDRQPVLELRIKKALKLGAKLVVIGPSLPALKRFTAVHIPVALEQVDAAVNAINTLLVKNGKAKGLQTEEVKTYLGQQYNNYDAGTELSAQLQQVATLLEGAETASFLYDEAATLLPGNGELLTALARLALATGQLSVPGYGLMRLVEDNNSWGALDMGVTPEFGPAYSATGKGLSYSEMVSGQGQAALKALLVMGANPLGRLQEMGGNANALANLELLVVQELFLSPTAEMAHVVLPAASFAEKEGTFTNTEGRVQHIAPAIPPLQGTAPDAAILLELANRLGAEVKTRTPAGIFDEIARVSPLHNGMSYAALGGEGLLRPMTREVQAESAAIPDWLLNAVRPTPTILIGTANAEMEEALEARIKINRTQS
ncbi:MAG TPA: NADH-quinone oxidoreductase subunit NuoG [Chloroflexia bacterium]|nr:NADH-quinone oxidoreductase subunit NuoG [Chloroflexia bacterium]